MWQNCLYISLNYEKMNTEKIKKIAIDNTPEVDIVVVENAFRHNVIDPLKGGSNIGIELGVAQGGFSKRMVDSKKFKKFYGVDSYSDTHDTDEYKLALKTVGINKNYNLLRMFFDDAYDLFEDNYFDFIYIDGYAHTGEEGGRTISKWYKKLKVGGVLAGDDYHENWPLVMWAVNSFVNQIGGKLFVTGKTEKIAFSEFPSWYIIKDKNVEDVNIPMMLDHYAHKEKDRIGAIRKRRVFIRNIERKLKKIFNR